jgi:hypothetical protein
MRNRFQFSRAKALTLSKILIHGGGSTAGCSFTSSRLYGKVAFMIALPTKVKWLGSGFGIWAALACSAEASSPPPASGGSVSTGGTAATTAGTSGLPLAGTQSVGQGGTGVGTAGTTAVGTAGTTAGGSTGAAGGGALAACPNPPAAGLATETKIDDLEPDPMDASGNALPHIGGRSGFWYTYGDALGSTITPMPDPGGANPLKPGSTNCHGGSMGCVIITGTTAMADEENGKYPYAGVGFDFSNAKKPCVYNASAYSGIKFWARGDVPITIKLNTVATATADGGGSCTGDTCNGGFSPMGVDVLLEPDWKEIDLNFAMAAPPSWAAALAMHPDKATVLSVQVQIPPGQTFNVALDDFTFY